MTSRDSSSDTDATVPSTRSVVSPHRCPACGTVVPERVVTCPGCGRGQTEPVPSGMVTASHRWGDAVLIGTMGWLGLLLAIVAMPGTPSLTGMSGPVPIAAMLWLVLAGYFDMRYVRQQTSWNPDTLVWLVGFSIWFGNIAVAALYLYRRRGALPDGPHLTN